jgi:Raf kinase inhibitor-like YbhB/YbcL family protein
MFKFAAVAAVSLLTMSAAAGPAQNIGVTIDGTENGHFPKEAVQCVPDGHGHSSETGRNVSPGVRWTAGPHGTKSYALVMTDPDVPTDMSALNKAGITISPNAARQTLYHWILINIPGDRTHLSPGDGNVFAEIFGVPKGNARGEGMNWYFAGYGGPCPPWNDMRPHKYRVRVFALNVAELPLKPPFEGKAFEASLSGHVLAQGEAQASYATDAALGTGY